MKKAIYTTMVVLAIAILALNLSSAWSDNELYRQAIGVGKVQFPLYEEECGSCHMAYPPGLLPARSWTKIMNGLESHFGDNAELDPESQQLIRDYLQSNSAEKSLYRRSRAMLRGLSAEDTPIRISKMPYFLHEHDELGTALVRGNTEVGSFSNCDACHQRAAQGLFSEHDIRIPGFGRWDD